MNESVIWKKGTGALNKAAFRMLLPLMVFIGGCASHSEPVHLYDVYREYSDRLRLKDYDYILDEALSSSMNNRGLRYTRDFEEYYPVLSGLPGILSRKTAHYEIKDGRLGCLTLNGYDDSDQPAVIKMEFKREQHLWKLDYVSVDFIDSPSKFMTTAVCPQRRA